MLLGVFGAAREGYHSELRATISRPEPDAPSGNHNGGGGLLAIRAKGVC
ncbi:hypothetical protein FraQA3DRAFT_0045 [Frankia sp. QA3]|nr:hypothetical protein FraQA3DRAFT_0045 [Frankia sp. QA3]